ncbi:hypothetical protein [Bacillus sp. PS06]|nr:hypothetical protein [Bacillus sp. PS06]
MSSMKEGKNPTEVMYDSTEVNFLDVAYQFIQPNHGGIQRK